MAIFAAGQAPLASVPSDELDPRTGVVNILALVSQQPQAINPHPVPESAGGSVVFHNLVMPEINLNKLKCDCEGPRDIWRSHRTDSWLFQKDYLALFPRKSVF